MKKIINIIKKNNIEILFILILFLAAFFRIDKLSTIPFGLNNDAAWEGSAALDILKGNISSYFPYAEEGWRGEGIIRIFVAFFIMLLGNDPIAIRLASVIFGIGLIIPVFFLFKNLFENKIALLTTFFIAISGWHITMSKTGWRAIIVPFFSSLLFYFFFKSLKSKKTVHYAIAGMFLTIASLYTYDAGRVILPFFICWLLFEIITGKNFFNEQKKGILIIFISFIIFALPIISYASNNWENFTSRSNFLFIGNQEKFLPQIANNIITSLLLFNVKANGNDFFIFEPLVDKPVSFLIPIGFIVSIYYLLFKKQKNFLFIFLWFFASLLPGILSSPNGNRAIGVIPSVYFFSALGLFSVIKPFEKIKFLSKLNFPILLIISIVISSSFITYNNYLGEDRRELRGFYPETLIATNYIKTIWENYDIYLTDNFPRELLTYYLYKDNLSPFSKNYTWVGRNQDFIEIAMKGKNITFNNQGDVLRSNFQPKGMAFFMFPLEQNELTVNYLQKEFIHSEKKYLWYKNGNINRTAVLVLLIPPKN